MKQSKLFSKTLRDVSSDEKSVNAQFLLKGGFVDKLMAGVYTYLPLGLRVRKKIESIIRDEMDKVGGQEILMPALNPKENWEATGRWDSLDVLFKLKGAGDKEYALGATHEEVVVPLVKKMVSSYKDLPVLTYQIQTKFRNEPRAKSGLLRGREFQMKDFYSFHAGQEDLDSFYERMKEVYFNVYKRVGLGDITYLTFASGGSFSKYSHEFQSFSKNGEDTVHFCDKCKIAVNKEIVEGVPKCVNCGNEDLKEEKAIEVGNIFKLATKYSEPFGLNYTDEEGREHPVIMGCYGIGVSRIMGAIAEIFNDEKGIIWPEAVAPHQVHLVSLGSSEKVAETAEKLYNDLISKGVEILYDDRDESAGVKLADSDLIGIPLRLIVSEKTLKAGSVEVKKRNEKEAKLVKMEEISKII